MPGEGKTLTTQPTHPVQADTGADHARPLTHESTQEQFVQRGARLPMWPDRGAASSSSGGYGPTSGYPARVQYLPSVEQRRHEEQQQQQRPAAPAPRGSVALEVPPRADQCEVQHVSLSPLLHPVIKIHVSVSCMQCIHFHGLGAVVADRRSLHNQRKLTIPFKTAHAADPSQTKLIFCEDVQTSQRNHA